MSTTQIRVQQDPRHTGRWAYVIDSRPHYFVSDYRYKTAESAQKAGERDLMAAR